MKTTIQLNYSSIFVVWNASLYRICRLVFSLIFIWPILLPVSNLSAQQDDALPESVIVRGLWRSGEMARYELNETTRIYNNDQLIEERELSTLVHIDVAARRPGDSYVLIWQILETNAPLFDDPELDSHMYGHLSDGIVIHTDQFGGFDHSSNMDELHGYFIHAVEELDRLNYWDGSSEFREQLQSYINDESLFESLLLRDMKFMFGLHGVQVYVDDEYRYDTWQENPWGEPITSVGRLFVEGYDEEQRLLTISNNVEMSEQDQRDAISLSETQLYVISARHGWPSEVKLHDEIRRDTFKRNRILEIIRVPF